MSLTSSCSQALRRKAGSTSPHASMWTCSSRSCCSEQVWSTESFLDEEGWEFRQGMVRMACLCSLMSGLHLGWLEAWGCRHLEMTHPVGAWAGMPWRLGSAGSVNRGPYVWPLHVARAPQIRAAQFQKGAFQEGHQRVNVSGELNTSCVAFLTQSWKLPSLTFT